MYSKMNKVEKFHRFMRFKSHFKKIPLLSSLIREIKWRLYKPFMIWRYAEKRKEDYSKKMRGERNWTSSEKALLALKNSHKGEIAFVIGNGPSLLIKDLEVLSKKKIFCFAFNRINLVFDKTSWRPSCYMASDRMIYRDNDPTIPTVINENLPLYLIGEAAYEGIPQKLKRDNVISFPIKPMSYYTKITDFSENAMLYVIDGATITYSAIQMAYYMGFNKVYLLGVDFNYNKTVMKNGRIIEGKGKTTYFDTKYDPNNVNAGYMDGMLQGYESAKKFCQTHDFKIINATRGGKLEVFERVNFDDLMSSL